MNFLIVSDLHYALKQFDWVARVASDFDVVVIAGDHLDISAAVDARAQVAVVLTYFKHLKSKTQLVVCTGNHDLDGRNDAGEKVPKWVSKIRELGIPTDGDCLSLGGTSLSICTWWDGPAVQAEIGVQLARDADKPKDRWIWVYHAPPEDSPTSWNGTRHFGDDALTRWIGQYQPDLVLAGHIHQSPFFEGGSWADRIGPTWVFNPGRQIGDWPTHIILNTVENAAVWFSLERTEAIDLSEPLRRPIQEIDQLPDWLKWWDPDGARTPVQIPHPADG